MLKGISPLLSPEMLKVLCEMGHSDRIVLADGNFPCESMGKNAIVLRCDGHGTAELLDAPGGNCVRELPCGVRVTLMNEMEGWYRVEAGSHQGYVQMQSLYSPKEPENVTALVNVRVRALPDLDAESLTWVKKKDKLQLLRAGETWSYVRANGQTGFVPTQYISMN